MQVTVFSTKQYDRDFLDAANTGQAELRYMEAKLSPETASLAAGSEGVCAFVNDDLSAPVLEQLGAEGVKLIALRSAGFNNVDLKAAAALGLAVARVPAYSPHAVAEHAIALVLTLNRKTHKAYNRVREGNFSLEGLLGFDLRGKTFGIVGTGKIGAVLAKLATGFGCRVLAHDLQPNPDCVALGVEYVAREALLAEADIVSLNCPLTPDTHHMIDRAALGAMKRGVMLINTSRGGLVDARAAIAGLKDGTIGSLGLDVYEEEADLFFEDLSGRVLQDDVFARLLSFPNVLVTGHQAFFTREALERISATTLGNIAAFEKTGAPLHAVTVEEHVARE